MKKKRFLVSAYFAKNLGDDLFLKVLFDRYPNVQWDLLTANRSYNEIFKKYKNVSILYSYRGISLGKTTFNLFYKLNELFMGFSKYDGLVNIGGSIFMQSPAWVQRKEEREYLLKKFKANKKKAFILGANFGPFDDSIFFDNYKEIFSDFDDICFREQYSFELFSNLRNVRVAPDIIFGLDLVEPFLPKKKKIGISLINLEKRAGLKEYQKTYILRTIQFIEKQISKGYEITLFSFCENEGDLEMINKIKEGVEPKIKNRIEVVNYEGNIESFLNKFRSCEIIIGTRFHSIILAILNNQAIFPIIYSEKTLNVLKDLNMDSVGCNIRNIENLNINEILPLAHTNRLINNKKISSEAELHFKKLDLYINKI